MERRTRWIEKEEEDRERKEEARRRKESWDLLKETINILKENHQKWDTRRIAEVERIRKEEKLERLAICKIKKKRFGIKKLNKEENLRLKERSMERILIAQARDNYWKRYREREK